MTFYDWVESGVVQFQIHAAFFTDEFIFLNMAILAAVVSYLHWMIQMSQTTPAGNQNVIFTMQFNY